MTIRISCFVQKKFDYTKHPNYHLTADADEKNTFHIEQFLNHELKLRANDEFEVIDMDSDS